MGDLIQRAKATHADLRLEIQRADAVARRRDVGSGPNDLVIIGDDAAPRELAGSPLRKDVVSTRDTDQLAHPADRADPGLVPLLEIHARPPLERSGAPAHDLDVGLEIPCISI